MTGVVPFLVPSSAVRGGLRRAAPRPVRRLPLPAPPPGRCRDTVYGLPRVDGRGRVADATVIAALGWSASTLLEMRVDAGRIVLRESARGRAAVSARGRLLLPAGVRRGCGIEPGDRVLLAADPGDGALVVYSPACLDAMTTATGPSSLAGAA